MSPPPRRERRSRRLAGLMALALAAAPLAAQAAPAGPEPNTLTPEERAIGWRLLFDGRTTDGWRGYMQQDLPAGWQAVDGAITRVDRGGDIITVQRFRNFELSLEWKVEPGGNSGIFYRGIEGPEQLYHSAPEMQVLDDERHPDGRSPLTSAGSDYGLYPAPGGAVKPAGEWNVARIVVRDNHVEHWLNGTKVVEYELSGADWTQRVAVGKFAQWPDYGKAPEGFIGLQDHGDRVAFRSIKIIVLP